MPEIIIIANQKGGVGKTTTAINLSSSLVKFKQRVLVVDMDPQGNCSRGLGIDSTITRKTLYEVLAKGLDINKAVQHTTITNLDLIPANLSLAATESYIIKNEITKPYFMLKNALAKLTEHYDYIIIDSPPSLGFLCLNGLVAATSVIIPVQCEYYAMEAVGQILSSIIRVQKSYNHELEIKGFLLTMYDSRIRLATEVTSEVRGTFKEKTFKTQIPRNSSLAECSASGIPVTDYKPKATGSLAYLSLAKEILNG